MNHSICPSKIVQIVGTAHSTESEKTHTCAVDNLIACSFPWILFQPWSLIPVDRAHSKYFILLIKDQFLRDGDQGPNLG